MSSVPRTERKAGRRRLLLAAAATLLAGPASSSEWREVRFPGKTPNRFVVDGTVLRVSSERAVSVYWKGASVDLGASPVLAWRWRVDRTPPPTDLARRGADDRALALYVAFAADPADESLATRIRRRMLEPFVDGPMPGRVLAYAWGGDGSTEGWFVNPYLGASGRIRVLRGPDAPTGMWLDETADLVADHEAAFGTPPGRLQQLGVGADTDDTASRAEAAIELLGFRGA